MIPGGHFSGRKMILMSQETRTFAYFTERSEILTTVLFPSLS